MSIWVILIEMAVFAAIFTALVFLAARGDRKHSPAAIHNYPPDIEDVTLNVSILHNYKDPEDATSYDGDAIKSEKALDILSGNITVSANDDGVNANANNASNANDGVRPLCNLAGLCVG